MKTKDSEILSLIKFSLSLTEESSGSEESQGHKHYQSNRHSSTQKLKRLRDSQQDIKSIRQNTQGNVNRNENPGRKPLGNQGRKIPINFHYHAQMHRSTTDVFNEKRKKMSKSEEIMNFLSHDMFNV